MTRLALLGLGLGIALLAACGKYGPPVRSVPPPAAPAAPAPPADPASDFDEGQDS